MNAQITQTFDDLDAMLTSFDLEINFIGRFAIEVIDSASEKQIATFEAKSDKALLRFLTEATARISDFVAWAKK